MSLTIHTIKLLRDNLGILLNIKQELRTLIGKIIKKASKNKEPIRPNRLYGRWDAYIRKPATLKYRVDSKRNPVVRRTPKGYLRKRS